MLTGNDGAPAAGHLDDGGPQDQAAQPAPRQEKQRTPHGDALVFVFLTAPLLLAVAAVAGHLLNLPRLWWALVTAAVTLGCAGVAHHVTSDPEPGAVTLWWWAALTYAGGWLAWVRFAYVKTPGPWLWLPAGAAVLAPWHWLAVRSHVKATAAAKRRAAALEQQREENRWPQLLAKTGCHGVKVAGREDTESGYVLALRLPGSGKVTCKKLNDSLEQLEVAANARRGSLHFEEGETARQVKLYVSTRDFLAETIPYEDDGQLLTILNPIPVGRYEDGAVCELTLREIAVLIVGLRGSGKSNLLNVLIAQLVRCVDVLVFVIDRKYRLVMPWVQPYLDDEGSGMAVDWAATGRDEVEKMLRAFLRGISARAESGAGGEKIEPDPHQPAVFLVIDEIASVFGMGNGPKTSLEGTTNSTLAGLGTEAVRLGRSEAMDLVAASQRGTVTMLGGGDFKSQFGLRIGLYVQNQADARSVIPDDQQAAKILASLRHEGTGLVLEQSGRVMRVKFFRITPDQVTAVARKYGPMKPEPEQVLAEALGEDYETRWERFRSAKKPTARTRSTPAEKTLTDQEFEQITGRLRDVEAAADSTPQDTAAQKRMLDFMGRSGERGVNVAMIVKLLESEHMPVSDRTVRNWLTGYMGRGIVERAAHGMYRVRKS